MEINIITLFPEVFGAYLGTSILKRAQEKGAVDIQLHNLRDFGLGKRKTTDDYSYGGGKGMVLRCEPVFELVEKVKKQAQEKEVKDRVIFLSPQGKLFNQQEALRLAQEKFPIFICGHYEGMDERAREFLVDEEISIGDYVLTGGEVACMVVVDAVVRLLPGVLESWESVENDSFYNRFLDWPHYTRPDNFRGMEVPKVLLSGDHQKVARWRKKEALRRTFLRRPELLEKAQLTKEEKKLLKEIQQEEKELKNGS